MSKARVMIAATVVAVAAALVGTASADSPPVIVPTLVTGAGYTPESGLVVVNAHATGPQFDIVAPATGFIRVKGSVYGNMTGAVACIGTVWPLLQRSAVSGTLDAPVTFNGITYTTFKFLIASAGGAGLPVRLYLGTGDPTVFDCGVNMFFADDMWAGGPYGGPPLDFTPFLLQSGRFTIH